MKAFVVQPPYPEHAEQSEQNLRWILSELDKCDETCDLIVLPEYCNAPSVYTGEEMRSYAALLTPPLLEACKRTAVRCKALLFVNGVFFFEGTLRNTTLCWNRNGEICGRYFKQHLPQNEILIKQVDNRYTFFYDRPYILEIEGIRFAFLTCYDFYFYEMFSHIAIQKPDIIIGCSHQRSDPHEILETTGKFLSYNCNAYLVRASVSMGEDARFGGCSMVTAPSGELLYNMKNRIGHFVCCFDPHKKYLKPAGFGNAPAAHADYMEQGRTPWRYRPGGSAISPNEEKLPYPRICAHRGFNTIAPENSLPAFGAAIGLGADEIELDLWETADGALVVSHDSRVDRVSNGTGKIQEQTLAQLKTLDTGMKTSPYFAGLTFITLEEVLKKFSCHTIMNLHIKSEPGVSFSRKTMEKIVDLLYKYDAAKHSYIAGLEPVLEAAVEVAPKISRCMLSGDRKWEIVERGMAFNYQKVQFFKPYINQELVERAHAAGMRCNVFYADDPDEAEQYFQMGVDTVLTNNYLAIDLRRKKLYR